MEDHPTAKVSAPAGHEPLPEVVAERLRELIIEGELPPGGRLNERQLGLRLGVSRTPLREALRRLAHDGLVTLRPNRGAVVTQLSRSAVQESFDVMGALEALAAELACRHITDAEVAEIEALTFEMMGAHARRDLPGYYRLNRMIHDRIASAARNAQLAEMAQTLNLRIQNLRFRSNIDPQKWDAALGEHRRMVVLLRARNADALAKLMREHLRRKATAVLAALPASRAEQELADAQEPRA
jgi:DNA-binding GntR family transcriptional regulator